MNNLGYTWYPKDWRTDEIVFNLTLEMRGFYREFIDYAYQNDNDFERNRKYFVRMLDITPRKFNTLFGRLLELGLIIEENGKCFTPSVDIKNILRRNAASSHIANKDVREEVFRLHGRKCLRCGSTENLTIDHVIPVYLNGKNEIGNYQVLCKSCNSSKGIKTTDYRIQNLLKD